MARLNTFVHVAVRDADGNMTGEQATFGPADTLPQWAIDAIANPKVWAEAPETPAAIRAPRETGHIPASITATEFKAPPKSGAGSGRDAWAAYATALGADVDPAATREQIIEAITAAGHPAG